MNNNYFNLLSLFVLFASSREITPNQRITGQITFLSRYKLKYYLLGLLILAMLMSCKKDRVKPSPLPDKSIEIAGQIYKTIKIGNHEWMISNYEGPGGVHFNTTNSESEYGKYYSWSEVRAISPPQGWRIPTKNDYIKMAEAEGIVFVQNSASRQEKIKSLTSKNNWRAVLGNNLSGFNAYPQDIFLEILIQLTGILQSFGRLTG